MKKTKKEDLRKRIMAYSAAAAGVLAIAPQANAAIQYSGIQNINLNAASGDYNLDLDGDGNTDFSFNVDVSGSVATFIGMDRGTAGNSWIENTYYVDPARLPSNYLVQTTLAYPASYSWDSTEGNDSLVSTDTTSTSGMFNNQRGFIGVRFNIPGCGQTFGWIQFQGTSNPGVSVSGRIIDWGYEDACQPILTGAGRTAAATIQPVPTISELGMLAMAGLLGGAAVNHLRKRRKEK